MLDHKQVDDSKRFGPYLAELVPNDDREGVNCFISHGHYSASLACAEAEGYLTRDVGTGPQEEPIAESILDEISAWALARGY